MANPVNCVRLFSDEHGETHFEDIEIPMNAIQYAPPAPAVHLSDPMATTQVSWLRFPVDWSDNAHPSPRRQLFILLTGNVEGWTSKGERRQFGAGDCLLMEDTVGKGHGARPINGEATAIMVVLA